MLHLQRAYSTTLHSVSCANDVAGILKTARGELNIRTAQISDLAAFKRLRLQALRDHPVAFSADYEVNLNADDNFWANYLDFKDNATIYLGIHRDDLIGMTGVRLGSSPKTRHSALIWGVYVQPEWRGLRVSDALIRNCMEWAKSKGAITAKLGVAATNQSAIRCYQRCGFEIYGCEPKAIFYDGTYYDEFLMSRLLDQP
jgi:RimJ/RimL family protein N-acetyltransferase